MYTKSRRKKTAENVEATAAVRDTDEEEQGNNKYNDTQQFNTSKSSQQRNSSATANNALSSPNLAAPHKHEQSMAYISHLLHEADLTPLVQLDRLNQMKYLLDERAHMIDQMEMIRTQYEKQCTSLKRRFDETESENDRLTGQHRLLSKELVLYKHLIDAPDNPQSTTKSKDYHQLKVTIRQVLKENEQLYSELNHFKTSDPVYEQVQILETTNQHLRQDLVQSTNENTRLKKFINLDEINHLKVRLTKTLEECEQLRLINQKLIQQCQQQPPPSSSPLSNRQEQFSPMSQRSSKSLDDNRLVHSSSGKEVLDLREHVHRLERTLHKRDFELEKLQGEIEKGTTSIMSSIEDLHFVSANVSSSAHLLKNQPSIDELQNQLDQLHDKLDELIRENQTLKNRTQEFDTIYEENEYLYAEKSQWNDELERTRIRQLVLEQEVHTLKEREKEYILTNEPSVTTTNANVTQLKLQMDLVNQTNNQLELEIVRLREQVDMLTQNYHQAKQDLIDKTQHYQQILEAAQDTEKLPPELARIEKLNADMEAQFEYEREEHEKTIIALEEQSEQREHKYSSLYDSIITLQNDYRQKEMDFVRQMDDVVKQRDNLHSQLIAFQNLHEPLHQENRSLTEEITSKNEMNRDLKLALTSSNQDAQTIYNQSRQLNTNLTDLQHKYNQEITERNSQIEVLRNEQKQMMVKYDAELLKTHQTIIQLQHENKQYSSQLERYRSGTEKLQAEISEKQTFIQQIQNDLSERSALHVSINNQLAQENKVRAMKMIELEQSLAQEQQHKIELQKSIQDLQNELSKSRSMARESLEKSEEFERRFHDTDRHFVHLNQNTEPTKRELNTLRSELITKSDQTTMLQHTIEDERLKRQRLEMKLKRLKDEYILVRKELYNRLEENNQLQHELVECRFKIDYYSQMSAPTNHAIKTYNENDSSTAVQLYLKEKADNQHCQLKCRNYQQKVEQLEKNFELIKEKYKQRFQEERDVFERTKIKYLDHLKNVQQDLQETRQLLEKDAELKINQESAYQQLVDERRQLLTSMIEKDAKVREMRRENLLLTSKIQLLENQMENLNDRVDRTLRERSQLRRDMNNLRLDSNVSIQTNARSSSVSPSSRTTTTYIESSGWNQPVIYTESFGFDNGHQYETPTIS